MKKTFKFLTLAVLLSMVGTVSAFAAKIVGQEMGKDGVTYKVIKLKVYNGNDVREAEVSIVSTGTPKTGQDVVNIPGEVILNVSGTDSQDRDVPQQDITFTVTEIAKVGYGNLNGVKTFNIPASIKEIKEGAFNNAAMEGNNDLKINFAAGSELEKIGDYAFGNCAIKTIDMTNCDKLDLSTGKPFASKQTGENNYLEEVKLPKGIKNIGTAFAGIPTLKTLDLSKTKVTQLENGALANTALTEVTIPAVTEATVQTVKIGSKAFENSPIKKLTINAPIAAARVIASDAFHGMPALKEVNFNGELRTEGAVPAEAFKDSKLEKVTFNKVATGAISADAFKGQSNLSSVVFRQDVAAGAIGANAFAGIGKTACATVQFSKDLTGAAAIGKNAFDGAGIETLSFKGNVANEAISAYAFNKITCSAKVRFEGTLGAKAIGEYAFNEAQLQYVLFAKAIDQVEAISPAAFNKASIAGSETADWAIRFLGALNAKNSIGEGAFQETTIGENIIFDGVIAGEEAISQKAFYMFKNNKGIDVLFNKSITGDYAIGMEAFASGAVANVTVKGDVSGVQAIGEKAFANNAKLKTLTVTGEVSNNYAIAPYAFANSVALTAIDLKGNIYAAQGSAVAPFAFSNAATLTGGATVNFGWIKSPAAIAAGAFSGAKLNVVNFSNLMAEKAIADNQFAASEQADFDERVLAATIGTVNFNAEFKAWPEAYNKASKNFVGNNAFTGTKVAVVNFNAPVSVPAAIYTSTNVNSVSEDNAKKSPFADNGAEMTINFKKGVVSEAFGPYAFAYSKTVAINLDKDAVYEEKAFRNYSFYAINWNIEELPTTHAVVNYTPANNSLADRAFGQYAFYKKTDVVDVRFKTTKYVLDLYTTVNQTTDKTPYRVKFVASKFIDLVWSPTEGKYVGTFSPENEMYAIDKYQGEFEQKPADSRKEVGVWSAYYDGRTLEAQNVPFSSWPARDHYTADLYINPLRVQNHIYYLNPGHTLIVTANFAGPVEATQVLDEDVYGGVQTFGDYNAWQCNDLRWNPAENKEWGGYVNYRAIQDGNTDWYGNRVRDYQLFRQCDYATEGIDWYNAINLPPAQQYLLVTNDKAQRIKYSSYEQNQNWFTGHDVPWEATVAERIEAAVDRALADGKKLGKDAAEKEILDKLNAELDADNQQSTIDDAIAAIIEEEVEKAAAADKEKQGKIRKAAEDLKVAIQNYVNASLDYANYESGLDEFEEDHASEYYFFEKYNDVLGKWELVKTTDPESPYDGDGNLKDNYRLRFPIGEPILEDGYQQEGWSSNLYDQLEDQEKVEFGFEFGDYDYWGSSYDITPFGYGMKGYENFLLAMKNLNQKAITEVPEGDNLYDVYTARANGEAEGNFEDWIDDYYDGAMLPDPVPSALEESAAAWQAVKDAFDAASANAKAYVQNPNKTEALWNALTEAEQNETKAVRSALKIADSEFNDTPYMYQYGEAQITAQNKAIDDYAQAKADYDDAVEATYREAGLETLAFIVYSAAVLKNETNNISLERDNMFRILQNPDAFFDSIVEGLTQNGRADAYSNYITAYNNRKAKYNIDQLNAYLEHLYASYLYDRGLGYYEPYLGQPQDAIVINGEEVLPAVEASEDGLYNELFNEETGLKKAKDDAVLALIKAVNGIEDVAPSRLNVIWNDGSDSQVVGIMEAVVNGTVTKDGDNVIYNLNGMRVKNTGKGVFIQNGKKVIK